MNVSLETTKARLEKTRVNKGKVENKMEVCLEEMKVETIRAPEDRLEDQQPTMASRNLLRRWTKDNVLGTPEGRSQNSTTV